MSNPHADRRRLCWANCNNSSCPKLSQRHPDCNLLTSPASEHASVSPCRPSPSSLLLLFLLLKPSCHSLRAGARPRGHSALPGPSARLAAINRSVLINLLIIDAIMCFICGTTRANVRRPNCRLGSHQASEKHLDNVVSIVDPLLLHLLVWLNVFCCGCCPFEVVSPGGNQAQRQFIHACRNCGKLKSDTFITWRSAKQ